MPSMLRIMNPPFLRSAQSVLAGKKCLLSSRALKRLLAPALLSFPFIPGASAMPGLPASICSQTVLQASDSRQEASSAVNDLVRGYWLGSPDSGEISPDHTSPKKKGGWRHGMLYMTLENYYQATGDAGIGARLRSEWNHIKQAYTDAQAEEVGEHSATNYASDDAGWCAMVHFAAYRATGDKTALDRAKGIVSNAFTRWMDDQLGGGTWYPGPTTSTKQEASHSWAGTWEWE